MFRKFVRCAFSCSLIVCFLCSCGLNQSEQTAKLNKYTTSYIDYFDTVCTIVGYEESKEEFDKVTKKTETLLSEYNMLYDIYHSYEGINNIRTINQNAGISAVKVDKKIIDLIDFSATLYELTGGTVNIAMGSVLSIWHDYRNRYVDDEKNAKLPEMETLREANLHTDFSKIIINREESTVYLSDAQMMLDVGAVAKGYATEEIAKILIADGVTNYALNFGGNIRTIGPKGDGSDWSAAVTNPDKTSEETSIMKVRLNNQAFVTSGSYERYYTVNGVRYHHIIDPKTLMPNNTFSAVSILAKDSGLADVLSTALFNLTYEQGKEIISKLDGVEALWVTDKYDIFYSDGFADIILK